MSFMLTVNQARGYANWFLSAVATPQPIFVQQNLIGASYSAPRVTGNFPTLWGWPVIIGKKKGFVPFTFIRDDGSSTSTWQFLPTAK